MSSSFSEDYIRYINYAKCCDIEFTYICPLQCPFCDRQDERLDVKRIISRNDNISRDNFIKLLKYFNSFYFCGQISDPIYHPEFKDLLDYCNNFPEKKVVIYTNGTRKKLNWWKEVFLSSHSNIIWRFGLDGTDQETANIYRVNTNFDEVFNVMKMGASMGANIEWHFIVFKHNEHQIDELIKLGKENGITISIRNSDRWPKDRIDKYKIYPPLGEQWIHSNNHKFIIIKPI
jgi:MoaA/NifB/PqqE/SkfB family radical SAM enzyme